MASQNPDMAQKRKQLKKVLPGLGTPSSLTELKAGGRDSGSGTSGAKVAKLGLHITLGGGFNTSQIFQKPLGNHENPWIFNENSWISD